MHRGLDAAECVVQHWREVAELDLRCVREGLQWNGCCPVHRKRGLSLTREGNGLLWKCHCENPCSQTELTEALRLLLPNCIGGRKPSANPRRKPIDPDDLTRLMLSALPPAAIKVAGMELAGWSRSEAMDKLGLARATRYKMSLWLSTFGDKTAGQRLSPNGDT